MMHLCIYFVKRVCLDSTELNLYKSHFPDGCPVVSGTKQIQMVQRLKSFGTKRTHSHVPGL